MALQDLTPQLRTRLSRVERGVGFFVTIATLLLIAGFAYYIYHTAQRKGWFKTKIRYQTGLNNAAGLKPGDPVKLMGFNVGTLTGVEANSPGTELGVTVYFTVIEPYYGYIWFDSKVKVAPADFLGNRSLEIVKGYSGSATVLEADKRVIGILKRDEALKALVTVSNNLFSTERVQAENENPDLNEHSLDVEAAMRAEAKMTNSLNALVKSDKDRFYIPLEKAPAYWIDPVESPALTERLETVVNGLEHALPNILDLTNKISGLLTNANSATSNLNTLMADARPVVQNVAVITDNLKDPHGSLGEWILPTNLSQQVQSTLKSADATMRTANETLATANGTLQNTDTNVTLLVSNINLSLANLANLTSNLNAQVQVNTNILTEISTIIVHTDELVQGLKRHWLLRSAFKEKKPEKEKGSPPKTSSEPPKQLRSPKDTR